MAEAADPIAEELLLLYELALCVGRDFDLERDCESFISLLQNRKEVAFGAVWLCPDAAGEHRSQLVFARPSARVAVETLPADHPTFALLGDEKFGAFHHGSADFDSLNIERGIRTGTYALYRLRDVGVLKLYSNRDDAFSRRELNQFAHVVEHFAVAIEASLTQEKLEREISEREAAQAALTLSEERFRDFADTAADWFWETDVDLKVSYLSDNHTRATRIDAEYVLHRSLEERWRADAMLDEARLEIVETMKARQPVEPKVLEWEGSDGTKRVHIFSGKPYFDSAGGFMGYRGSARDITAEAEARGERERLQAQLTQAQKMEAIGQLTGGISHDFNNILATVLGFAELAQDVVPANEERLARYLDEIHLAGERARNLVAQMLTFSRGGSEEVGEVKVASVLEESARLLRSTMPSTIQLNLVMLAPDATIESDSVSLQQVLMNLCINARDAMPAGKGSMDVVLEEEESPAGNCDSCHAKIEGRRVVLTVHDSGSGIPDEIRDRIFEPFFTTKAPGKGSGMGLSMVHGIVHRHHGHLQVKGRKDQGTTVRVHWPALMAGRAELSTSAARVHVVSGRGERVLIVDDEPSVCSFLSEILSRRGYRAESLVDSREALVRVRQQPSSFDLLITDLTMPQVTGLELIDALREAHGDLPVLLCSGYADSVDTAQLNDRTVFLHKPVRAADLVSQVQSLLEAAPGQQAGDGV